MTVACGLQMLKEAAVSIIKDLAASVFGKAQGFLNKAKARTQHAKTS